MSVTSALARPPKVQRRRQLAAVVLCVMTGLSAAVLLGRVPSVPRARPANGALLARAPYLQNTMPTALTLVWHTYDAAGSQVRYQLAAPVAPQDWATARSQVRTVRHVVTLTGLQPGTVYRYQITSLDGAKVLWDGEFQTNKPPGQPFHFAVWGDSGEGSSGQQQVAAQIDQDRPDLLVHTGDLIYEKGQAEGFDPRFFRIYAPTLGRVPFYGCLGNHDIYTAHGQPFLDAFVFPANGPAGLAPERNYAFDYGDAHFAVIDSTLSEPRLRQFVAPWLENDLQRSRAVWKFAVFHHPVFSSGMHGDEISVQRVLAPIFSRQKVDVVFNGHDHDYERFKPHQGVVYLVTGEGGAVLRGRHDKRAETAQWVAGQYSFTRVEINGRSLRGRQINADGRVIDEWEIDK